MSAISNDGLRQRFRNTFGDTLGSKRSAMWHSKVTKQGDSENQAEIDWASLNALLSDAVNKSVMEKPMPSFSSSWWRWWFSCAWALEAVCPGRSRTQIWRQTQGYKAVRMLSEAHCPRGLYMGWAFDEHSKEMKLRNCIWFRAVWNWFGDFFLICKLCKLLFFDIPPDPPLY